MKSKVLIEQCYYNKNHFTIKSNFDLQSIFKIKCHQGRKNEPIIIKGKPLWSNELTRLDYKRYKDSNFNHEIISNFNQFLTD